MAKKIFTSYYSMSRHIPAGIVQVAISLVVPHWWQPIDRQAETRLAPDKSAFRKDNWKELYQKKMLRLAKNGILQAVVDRLPEGCILLCYERDSKECHRSIALQAMIEFCGVEGSEFIFPERMKPEKKPRPEQTRLFG